ncbi:protein of unknown function [Legionella fallonii LLAP-10]|uniref:Uncharacterized protein n=1 Tax=Legionella fallonii LLAP-10 TaxID=1212491 RepID=A0A098G7M3_9GAMM|nr:protein of unknown function [Legionella fallonii LLAP-10]
MNITGSLFNEAKIICHLPRYTVRAFGIYSNPYISGLGYAVFIGRGKAVIGWR